MSADSLIVLASDLFELAKDSPLLLRDAVLEYYTAVQLLLQGKNRHFQRQLRKAQKAVAEAAVLHEKVSLTLDQIETRTGLDATDMNVYLRVSRQFKERDRDLFPEMHTLLDSLE
jgi:hypothetical protein